MNKQGEGRRCIAHRHTDTQAHRHTGTKAEAQIQRGPASEPTEEQHDAVGAVDRVFQKALRLRAQVPVLYEHGDVALGGDGQALDVEQAAPVEQRVESESSSTASPYSAALLKSSIIIESSIVAQC